MSVMLKLPVASRAACPSASVTVPLAVLRFRFGGVLTKSISSVRALWVMLSVGLASASLKKPDVDGDGPKPLRVPFKVSGLALDWLALTSSFDPLRLKG